MLIFLRVHPKIRVNDLHLVVGQVVERIHHQVNPAFKLSGVGGGGLLCGDRVSVTLMSRAHFLS